MTTVVAVPSKRALEGEQRVVLRGVGWGGYEALLAMIGDGRVRITYDRGDAELMSPSYHHENSKKLLGWMIETVAEELDIDYEAAGSTTWRKEAVDRGLEADECFYFTNLERIREKRNRIDLTVDPPPDLAVEVEISRSALSRMGVYAALGVPEVWRFDGETLVIERLGAGGEYQPVDLSPGLPELTPGEAARWVRLAETTASRVQWNRRFRAWVRAELLPRREGR